MLGKELFGDVQMWVCRGTKVLLGVVFFLCWNKSGRIQMVNPREKHYAMQNTLQCLQEKHTFNYSKIENALQNP